MMSPLICLPRPLSAPQSQLAIRRSIEINPENAAGSREIERTPPGRRGGPKRLALLVGNRWPKSGKVLSVQFLDTNSVALKKRILAHMNAWNKTANIRFEETAGTGLVRIARLDGEEMGGYWSYVGTQILAIEEDQPTLNLEGFTMKTAESEFRRVVRHEAGHTMGFEHEHMRTELVKKIDRNKAIKFFDRTQGWTAKETMEQVLTPLSARSIMGTTESDPLSIMCYQIPGAITKDGKTIEGGVDINDKDFEFAGTVYPKPGSAASGAHRDADSPPAGEVLSAASSPPFVTDERDGLTGSGGSPGSKAGGFASMGAGRGDGGEFHLVIMDEFDPEGDLRAQRASGAKPPRPKYARVFASYDGARVTSAMRLRADKGEESTAYGHIISIHERIKKYTDREEGSLPDDAEMIQFGGYLFDTLFQGDVRRLYDEARARQRSNKLSIVITSMVSWIAEKPWEFAYDTVRRRFLATEEIHMLRNVITAVPADLVSTPNGPLRILVAAAQPVGFAELSVEQEVEVIRRGFEPLIDAGLVTIKVLARATPGDIHSELSTGAFNIVHFIGHGLFDEAKQEGALVFEDGKGRELILGERSVREIFCQRGVSLVFLNACQTGTGSRADFNKGVAQALVSHGLPALIANQYSVLDSSATSFAQHFYWALAQGMSISQAACEARIAVNYSMQGESIDWAVPVVYARDPLMTLSTKPEKPVAAPSAAIRRGDRLPGRKRSKRVAVWDVDNSFPSLESTLREMNKVQEVFGFEVVPLSAPLDAWDIAEDGTAYLWADKVAHRLEKSAIEHRVDVLACVTRHWMRNNDWLNLYGWWPFGQKPPVVIFSCAGLDLPPAGLETDRAIANVMTMLLSGFLTGEDSHAGHPKCPLYLNLERDLSLLTGLQTFDQRCMAMLKKKIPGEAEALAALLKTFH